ncbi:MAG: hypothetical protein OHK0046_13400 [Anaerolineae bacterium]
MLPYVVDHEIELRPLEEHYAPAMFKLVEQGRAYLRQWQNWPDRINSLADMVALIRRSQQKRLYNDGFDAVILYRGQPAGKVGFVAVDWIERRAEIGYWLGQSFQGLGLMTRSTRALVNFGLTEMGLDVVHIRCAVENVRSAAIPKRLGFVYNHRLSRQVWIHGFVQEEAVYVMTRKQWRNHMIYHITTRSAWDAAQPTGEYRAASLETQGFIHLSHQEQVLKVANAVYCGQKDLVLLCVDPTGLDVREEAPDASIPAEHESQERFPHLYGGLPLHAVVRVLEFPVRPDGTFRLPSELL